MTKRKGIEDRTEASQNKGKGFQGNVLIDKEGDNNEKCGISSVLED